MLSELQKETAQAIVNIFETGSVRGDYARVTLLTGDSGHLTYGRAQTTLGSGNLHLLIKAYCATPGAAYARALKPYLPQLADIDLRLDTDWTFRNVLKEAGGDPVMRDAQDDFFDRVYWTPAMASARRTGLGEALSAAVVYDSAVHGSWTAMRDRTTAKAGSASSAGERKWIGAYLDTRRDWLASHSNSLLRKTVYRMDAFRALAASGNWSLDLPMTVRGVRIDTDTARPSSARQSPRPSRSQRAISVSPIRKCPETTSGRLKRHSRRRAMPSTVTASSTRASKPPSSPSSATSVSWTTALRAPRPG